MTSNNIYNLPLAYVYKITNKETGEFYIGSRTANIKANRTPENDIGIEYFTSSKSMSKFKQYPDKFNIEILFRSSETIIISNKIEYVAYWYEQLSIRNFITNHLCLNGQYQDPNTCKHAFLAGNTGKIASFESKKKMSVSHLGQCRPHTEDTKINIGIGNSGKVRTEKMNEVQRLLKLQYYIDHPEAKISLIEHGKKSKGRKHEIITCPYCNKSGGASGMAKWHFNNCKYKPQLNNSINILV